ncbi:hypothetical protein BLA29_002551, partial [Euroglyphus maynei]
SANIAPNSNNNREKVEPHPNTESLKINVDDDVDDYQLLDAVINLGIDSNVNTSSSTSNGENVITGTKTETRSSSVTTSMAHRQRIPIMKNVAKTTVIQQQNVLNSAQKIPPHQSSSSFPQRQSADGQSSQAITSVRNSPRKPKRMVSSPANNKNTSKNIPIPTTRTTIQNRNNQKQLQPFNNNIGSNGDHSDTGSFDDRSAHSLLDNTKPPSIIDNHSLMSQSSASIDSEISDIGIDNVPLRKSNSQDLLVAKAASNCAKEINTLVQSCVNDNNNNNNDDDDSSVKDSSSSLSTADGYHHHHHHKHSLMKTYNRNDGDGHQSTIPQQTSRTLPKMKIAHSNQPQPKQRREAHKSSNDNGEDLNCDQRTYNKNDYKRNKNDQQQHPIGYNYYESDQSDTDISEILPLDDCDPSTIASNHIDYIDGQTTTSAATTTNESNTATIVLYNKPNIDPNPSMNDPFLAQMLSTSSSSTTLAKMINKSKELSSSITTNQIHSVSHNNNNDESYGGHQLERLEDLESETRYRPNSRNRSGNDRMEELDFTNGFNQQFYPFNHDRPLNFVQNSRSLNRGHKFMTNNTKADFEDRDMMFTSKHRKQVVQSHARYFQNKSSTTAVKTSSKYFDRHPIVGADNGTTEMELLMDSPPRLPTSTNHSQLLSKQQKQTSSNNAIGLPTSTTKSKEKSLLSNIKSKLFSSPKPGKKSDNVKSKIKLWPR